MIFFSFPHKNLRGSAFPLWNYTKQLIVSDLLKDATVLHQIFGVYYYCFWGQKKILQGIIFPWHCSIKPKEFFLTNRLADTVKYRSFYPQLKIRVANLTKTIHIMFDFLPLSLSINIRSIFFLPLVLLYLKL